VGLPIPLLKLPAWDRDVTIQPSANRLWQIFAEAPPDAMDPVIAWLQRKPVCRRDPGRFHWHELRHELSCYMVWSGTETFTDGRTLIEYQALRRADWLSASVIASGSFQAFCEVLRYFHRSLGFRQNAFRTGKVYTRKDQAGVYTVYPDPEVICVQLERIYAHWRHHFYHARGFAAVVAMTAILNLHPFPEGNGRVARLFFNWTMSEGRDSPLYLPIYELSALSQYGYLIRLRQAGYHSEWHPLFSYLLMCSERFFTGGGPNSS
jgi:hypothetical protein